MKIGPWQFLFCQGSRWFTLVWCSLEGSKALPEVSGGDLLGSWCEVGGRLRNELGRRRFPEKTTFSPGAKREGPLKLQG